jgi:hypothetical protein
MKTAELRKLIKDINLSGLVSLEFNRAYCEGKNYHVLVDSSRLSFETSKEQHKVFSLLVSKFGFTRYSDVHPYISEEERGYNDGWAADMANPKQHGRTVAVCLSGDGNGSHLVWDYNLQKCVEKSELTPAPVVE